MLPQGLEEAGSMHVVERRLASLARVQQVAGRPPRRLAPDEEDLQAQLTLVSEERSGHRGQLEAAVLGLSEDALAGEQPEHSAERGGVGARRRGKVCNAAWTVRHQVGEPQLGGDVDGLADPKAAK